MRGKKAQVSGGLTWFVAFTIIFFIMFLFTLGAGGLATSKWAKGENVAFLGGGKVILGSDVSGKVVLNQNVFVFLNQKATYDGEIIFVKDLIVDSESEDIKERAEIFEIFTNKFFNDNYPLEEYDSSWIRIYAEDENVFSDSYEKEYAMYWAKKGMEKQPEKFYCKPEDSNSLTTTIKLNDKTLAVCVRYK